MNDKAKTVCFTGHREIKDTDEVKKRLLVSLEKLIIIAYQRRKSGETAYTVEYALTHKIEVINIAK